MMSIQELQTINHHKINAKIIVINNNIYSIIRRRQNELFEKGQSALALKIVLVLQILAISKTFGFKYICSKTARSLNSSLDKLLHKRPTILEIYGRHDQSYIEIAEPKI